ncbi:MAG: SycD/LcrH family type III secretion system chaperone [Waddliaceae bacterium]
MLKKKKQSGQGNFGGDTMTIEERREKAIEEIVERLPEEMGEEEKQMQKEVLKKVFIEGLTLKEAAGIGDDFIDFVYSEAFRLYQSGKYKEAGRYFRVLVNFEPIPRHVMGLAASHHQMKEFDMAVAYYLFLASIDTDSPVPFYHTVDCYIQQELPDVALFWIKRAIERCGDDPKYSKLKARSYATMSSLEEKLGIEGEGQESPK